MILLVNDDGIDAAGLRSLYRGLRQQGKQKVLAVAPSKQRSGMGHAITINRGLQTQPIYDAPDDFFGFSVDGTPTDCLKLALKVLAQEDPKLVISELTMGQMSAAVCFIQEPLAQRWRQPSKGIVPSP